MKEPFKPAEKQNRWLQDKARKIKSNKAPFLVDLGVEEMSEALKPPTPCPNWGWGTPQQDT